MPPTETIDMSDCECCQQSGSGSMGGCTGFCSWIWNGADWDLIPNPADECSFGCVCSKPVGNGFNGELRITFCYPQ